MSDRMQRAPTPIAADCFSVIAYFSYFQYPLTAFEVWKWLYMPSQAWSLVDVMTVLEKDEWLRERVGEWNGFYGMGDVESAWRDRHSRYLDAMRKYAALRLVAALIGRLPSVEGVFVCNSLAYHHTNEESDSDLCVVTKSGRVWTARLFVVLMLALLRKRPGEAKRDPVCASFFVDVTTMDFSVYAIEPHDPYLAYWTATLIPLVDREGVTQHTAQTNTWTKQFLPNAQSVHRAFAFRRKKGSGLVITHFVTEKFARRFQEKRFTPVITALLNVDSRVVVNDHVLKFHTNDRRAEIATTYKEKLSRI